MRNYYLDDKCRTEYLRMLLKILVKKYHVNLSSLARGIGIRATYLNDFVSIETRVSTAKTLDKIEGYINDLYESIVIDEGYANARMIEDLKARSQQALLENAQKKMQKNTTR